MNKKIYSELKEELTKNILPYWEQYSKDPKSNGFYGAIDNSNKGNAKAWRSIVMVSRYLWSYSQAARLLKDKSYLDMADYAYAYMMKDFRDPYYGGVYWSVKQDGSAELARKQIYGEAFACYALSEYACAVKELRKSQLCAENIMSECLSIYNLLEKYALDKELGGYAEALNRDWSFTKETSLSAKDIDCAKSMNTNLHVMEAYTNLYRNLPVVYPENKNLLKAVGKSLSNLVKVHLEKILNKKDFHLDLYFNDKWQQIGPDEISYGHDIEASWLLWEAAEVLQNESLMKKVKAPALKIAEISYNEGFDQETGAFDNTMLNGKRDTTRVWWNQAEAINGFYNAWQLTGDEKYSKAVERIWEWVKAYQKDKSCGEWFASVTKEGKPVAKELKGGNWKTSYHNGRCCMELLKRK